MKILLSIKPKYVTEIFEGRKKFEYRKSIFKRKDIKSVVVYATKPVGKIIGEFEIGNVLEFSPNVLWEKTKDFSGIDKDEYMRYFNDRDRGFAIGIKSFIIYDKPLKLNEFDETIKVAPQSFRYIS